MDNTADKEIAIHIDRAMSACFEMISELMYMRTIDAETDDDRYVLRNRLDYLVDMDKSLVHEFRKLIDLI